VFFTSIDQNVCVTMQHELSAYIVCTKASTTFHQLVPKHCRIGHTRFIRKTQTDEMESAARIDIALDAACDDVQQAAQTLLV
jgi:hypothetical protein